MATGRVEPQNIGVQRAVLGSVDTTLGTVEARSTRIQRAPLDMISSRTKAV